VFYSVLSSTDEDDKFVKAMDVIEEFLSNMYKNLWSNISKCELLLVCSICELIMTKIVFTHITWKPVFV
jgi:hypothetical protein